MSEKMMLFVANLVGTAVGCGMLFGAFKAGELNERKKWQPVENNDEKEVKFHE